MKHRRKIASPDELVEMTRTAYVIGAVASETCEIVLAHFDLSSPQGHLAHALTTRCLNLRMQATNLLWEDFALSDPFDADPPVADAKLTTYQKGRGRGVRITLEQHRALAERVRLIKTVSQDLKIRTATLLPRTFKFPVEARKVNDTANSLCHQLDEDWCRLRYPLPGDCGNEYPYYWHER